LIENGHHRCDLCRLFGTGGHLRNLLILDCPVIAQGGLRNFGGPPSVNRFDEVFYLHAKLPAI
jgi:hypothetical protein